MRTPLGAALSLMLALCPGCYLFHEIGGEPGEPAPRVDAGRSTDPPPVPDAGRSDAGPPLPPEPDPDLGPGSRPSDYPDADEWEDPPDVGSDDPCCVLGELRELTSRDAGVALDGHPPLIEWGAGRWGVFSVSYYDDSRTPPMAWRPMLWQLEDDGTPMGEPLALELPPGSGGFDPWRNVLATALRYGEGRWAAAVVAEGATGGSMHARLYDRELRAASEWTSLGIALPWTHDLARITHGDVWLGIGSTEGSLQVTPFDERGTQPTVAHTWPESARQRAVGLRSRVAALQYNFNESRAPARVAIVGPGPGYELTGEVSLGTAYPQVQAFAAVRDLVVVAAVADGRVAVEVVDPFGVASVAGPRTIGSAPFDSDAAYGGGNVDVGGSDKFGLAGVCWGVPSDPPRSGPSRIMFGLVDERGEPHGRPVTVTDAPFRAGLVNCSVGSDDLGFLVGWWDGSTLWVRRVDLAP